MLGIVCPYCNVEANKRCMTSGGNVYGELCHKLRRDAAYGQGVSLTEHRPPPKEVVAPKDPPDGSQGIKLALWYIKTAGGIEKAQQFLDGAAAALELTEEPS